MVLTFSDYRCTAVATDGEIHTRPANEDQWLSFFLNVIHAISVPAASFSGVTYLA